MKRSHVMLAVTVGLLLVLGRPTDVRADKKLAQEYFKKGMAAFTLEKYEKAIDEFITGFEYEPDPVFLFNIAQAYRLSNHGKEAIKFYRKYLQLAPHANNRRMVEEKIAALTKALGPSYEPLPLTADKPSEPSSAGAGATGPTPNPTSAAPENAPPAASPPAGVVPHANAVPAAVLKTAPPPPVAPRRRWPVWVGIAAGVAAAGLGVGLGVGLTQSRPTELPLQDAR